MVDCVESFGKLRAGSAPGLVGGGLFYVVDH
jgi:hypothetical protein